MESLYDVFSAIRDDEGDHVSTMEACLDPNVAKLSPSLEKKFLTGIAAAVAVAVFLNTGADIGIGGDELSGVADGVDLATDSGLFGMLDAADPANQEFDLASKSLSLLACSKTFDFFQNHSKCLTFNVAQSNGE